MKAEMKTQAGVRLTSEEEHLVKSLKRVAKKWDTLPNRLWLFSGGDSQLYVMMAEGGDNTHPNYINGHVNQDNIVCTINIPNDGGGW